MATIVTRAGKGSPLTHNEVDANFNNLNSDKLEASNNLSDLDDAAAAVANLGITASASELNILDGATVTTAEINQLDADSTGALKVPTGTVAQRPTPAQGQIRFNSDDTTFEGYDGTAWGEIGGDFSAVAADIIPDADSTRDLGSSTKAWAEAHVDTVISTNVSDGTLSIPTTYVTNGSAKAWVNFNGTGTIAARDSLNVSSLTDISTGNYTQTFTSSISNTNFAANFSIKSNSANVNYAQFVVSERRYSTSRTASSVSVVCTGELSQVFNNPVDVETMMTSIYGDLA